MMVRSTLGIAALVVLAAPGLASAQVAPSPGPAVQPMPAGAPSPGPAAQPMPMQPQPYGQSYNGYAMPPPAPASAAAPRSSPRGHGLTVEVGLGFGQLSTDADGVTTEESGGAGALSIGGWLSPNLAISFRVNAVSYTSDAYGYESESSNVTKSFYGATLQYWFTDSLWMGGGLGGGEMKVKVDDGTDYVIFQEKGVSADLRVGFTPLVWNQSSLNVSLEVSPLWLEDASSTALAVLASYQYL